MEDWVTIRNLRTKEEALYELDKLEEKWGKKYPIVFKSWRNKWENLTVYFQYPEDIRRVIYTTRAHCTTT